MASSELRKVKEVNGWKVNHPHSAANIFYLLFTLVLLALPLAFLFLPVIGDFKTSNFTGIDALKYIVTYVVALVTGDLSKIILTPFMQELCDSLGEFLAPAGPYLITGIGGLLAVSIIFSIVLLILFVVLLIKGYLKHSKSIKVFASLSFVVAILICVINLVFFFGIMVFSKAQIFIWYPFIVLAVYLVVLIVISAIYGGCFKDSIPETELEYHEDSPVVEHVTKVHEVTKVKYEGSTTLPPNLESIGGHAFAENQNLVVANIPINITKLGNSAFANCLKLKVVSIPTSVIEIGFNCFFNCVELERINYAGTKDEWKKIARGSNWLAKAKTSEVVCVDGSIIVNPYH